MDPERRPGSLTRVSLLGDCAHVYNALAYRRKQPGPIPSSPPITSSLLTPSLTMRTSSVFTHPLPFVITGNAGVSEWVERV